MMMRKSVFWLSKAKKKLCLDVVVYLILSLVGFLVLLPLLFMISTAFKDLAQAYEVPMRWIPHPFRWNIPKAMALVQQYGSGLLGAYWNTLVITLSTLVGQVFSCSLVAFGFSRFRFRGRDAIFFLFLATMIVPYQVTMIPTYIFFSWLGWINTYKPLIIPAYFATPFYVFLLRQFFLTIPMELDESARIDGAGTLVIFSRIILPLSKPALATVALFSFTATWNALLAPLVYISDMKKYTISLVLNALASVGTLMTIVPYHLLMLLSLMTMIPCIVFYIIGQRYYIRGIVMSGLKG